jgi:hypothetical protein
MKCEAGSVELGDWRRLLPRVRVGRQNDWTDPTIFSHFFRLSNEDRDIVTPRNDLNQKESKGRSVVTLEETQL